MTHGLQRKPALVVLVGLGVLFIVTLTLWAYTPALDAPFVFDDEDNIVNSPAIRWTEFSWDNVELLIDSSRLQTRPVANFSFALNHLVGGLEPRGFHFANVLIHLLTAAALVWLCVIYSRNAARTDTLVVSDWQLIALSLLPVGLFLLHPLNTQAVTYVVQRMASLAALFTLLAFASYLTARYGRTARSRWWYVASFIFWILGIGSKENALLLLPVILLYEICFFRGQWRQRIERVTGRQWNQQWTAGAWVGVGVAVGLVIASTEVIRFTGDFPSRDYNGIERMMTQARVQVFHLSQLVWPAPGRLNLDHDVAVSRGILDPWTTLPAILICIGLLAAAAYVAARRPRYGFPVLAYAVFHMIEAGPIGLEIIYEHRMYLPSTMLAVAGAVALVDSGSRTRRLAVPSVLLVSVLFAAWTHERNLVWADPIGFRADIAAKSPNKARAQSNYALALYDAGRSEEALPVSRRAVELDREEPRLLVVLGDILVDLGRPDEAADVFRTAIGMDPTNVKFVLGLGSALAASGDEEAAFRLYLDSGVSFGRGGRPWEAIMILKEAVALRSEDAIAHNTLGNVYMAAGQEMQAIEQFRTAIELDPEKIEAWYNLGFVADKLGRRDEAIYAYRGFLERAPASLQQHIERASARVEVLSGEAGP
jgi:tetratricopeptide (TPR) repeat protein